MAILSPTKCEVPEIATTSSGKFPTLISLESFTIAFRKSFNSSLEASRYPREENRFVRILFIRSISPTIEPEKRSGPARTDSASACRQKTAAKSWQGADKKVEKR